MTPSPHVLRHVIDCIAPASASHAEGARHRVAAAAAPLLEQLAMTLGGAQHTTRPRATHRTIVVCAGDHGVGDPGISLGAAHPTVVSARAIADGSAALSQVAMVGRASIVLVDAGVAEPTAMPRSTVQLARGPSRNFMHEPAMTRNDATRGLEAGIALAVALVDNGLDVLVVGALGVGADVASAALLGASLGPEHLPHFEDSLANGALARGAAVATCGGLELLAAFGGQETAVLTGVLLGAASMNVPSVLDGYATGAAALVAAALAPTVTGYFIAAHRGTFTQPHILARLGLTPVFDVGLGHGEGTGAAMVLPLIEQVTTLAGTK